MEGHYSHLIDDVRAGVGSWKWVRLDPASLTGVDLSRVWLRDLDLVHDKVAGYSRHDAPLPLAAVAEGT